MFWNAFTGMLIGTVTALEPPDVVTPMLMRATTFESGCAVPIWDVELYESSYFPAAAGVQENVAFLRVCVA
jgi:hypothetical protein